MKIVLLNAPPRAGKDTAAHGLVTAFENQRAAERPQPYIVGHHKMSESLKRGAHALFGLDLSDEYLEDNKDKPMPELMNKSPRQVYISLSEDYVKPHFGVQAFGWMFVNRLRNVSAWRLLRPARNIFAFAQTSDLRKSLSR